LARNILSIEGTTQRDGLNTSDLKSFCGPAWLWLIDSTRILPLFALLALTPVIARAQADSVQSAIVALENSWNEAELHHDSVALARLMSDDLVLTEPDGSVIGKSEEVAFTADPEAHFESLESHDLRVQVHGDDTAIVSGAYHEKGTFHGKPFEHRGRFTDTWVRHGHTWQCVAGHFSVPVKD
jgi:ketosteroid isomerase-like protein